MRYLGHRDEVTCPKLHSQEEVESGFDSRLSNSRTEVDDHVPTESCSQVGQKGRRLETVQTPTFTPGRLGHRLSLDTSVASACISIAVPHVRNSVNSNPRSGAWKGVGLYVPEPHKSGCGSVSVVLSG